jgi:hypothetical protein
LKILVDNPNAAAFFRSANCRSDTRGPRPDHQNVKAVIHCVRTRIFGWQTI